jgi:hypothetical protein
MPIYLLDRSVRILDYAGDLITVANPFPVTATFGGTVTENSQTQVRNAANSAWINVGVGAESATILHVPVRIQGTGANVIEPLNTNPAGTEYALPVRDVSGGIKGIKQLTKTFTISGTYAPGDSIGTIQTYTGMARIPGGGVKIRRISVNDRNKQNSSVDVLIFNDTDIDTVFVDNAPAAVANTDLASGRLSAVIQLNMSEYSIFTTNSCITKGNIDYPFLVADGVSDLKVGLICRGTPTYSNNVVVQITVEQY